MSPGSSPETAYRGIIAWRGGAALIEAMLPAYETGEAGEFFRARRLGGLDGLVAYWREHQAVCERALEVLGLEMLAVEPDVFDAQAWPLEVVFESAARGGLGRLSIRR